MSITILHPYTSSLYPSSLLKFFYPFLHTFLSTFLPPSLAFSLFLFLHPFLTFSFSLSLTGSINPPYPSFPCTSLLPHPFSQRSCLTLFPPFIPPQHISLLRKTGDCCVFIYVCDASQTFGNNNTHTLTPPFPPPNLLHIVYCEQ